jgi:hypothetical protein
VRTPSEEPAPAQAGGGVVVPRPTEVTAPGRGEPPPGDPPPSESPDRPDERLGAPGVDPHQPARRRWLGPGCGVGGGPGCGGIGSGSGSGLGFGTFRVVERSMHTASSRFRPPMDASVVLGRSTAGWARVASTRSHRCRRTAPSRTRVPRIGVRRRPAGAPDQMPPPPSDPVPDSPPRAARSSCKYLLAAGHRISTRAYRRGNAHRGQVLQHSCPGMYLRWPSWTPETR